ncbi:alpha/beta hydrolase [Labilibaculum euxinus]|uniref:Alpha/beta fold hydrolase n=1 Tax=Labilibaculum euxinus TaxID=2686357 RepID=A0A7M4DAK8_9BACT|nr:hypothetical protein [Labilibaculum euxinus]MUP39687.1 hypothetical protein [Labilibaculum euxinus]MVB08892.1 hypothetical protein [Labilibaculum euxinus]
MKNILLLLFALSLVLASCNPASKKAETAVSEIQEQAGYPELVEFESLDSLIISAHLYQIDETSPYILLCHQARFNKFEYAGIAERLNEIGFNCLAIDQRSGGPIGNTQNETYLRALKAAKGVDYLDAEADITAAIDYLTQEYTSKVILWGSSYSSTLALYIAADREDVSAVISFSPGNYLAGTKGSLVDKLENFAKPMFLTSSNSEAKSVTDLLAKHKLLGKQVQFIPEGAGHHGSRALWKNQQGGEEYWKAVTDFLNQLK